MSRKYMILLLGLGCVHFTGAEGKAAPPVPPSAVFSPSPPGLSPHDTLTCPDPSPEAVALFRYLHDLSGKKILSGQMWAPWGVDELNYLKTTTGKLPAVRGADLITESANNNEVQNEINWWKNGGIPTIMWHWGAPGVGEGYENSKVEIDIDKCFQEGTVEYNEMWRELKLKADHLQVLRDANVPVLWRPLHELNGSWFWWGKQGPGRFKLLWRTMYDYFVHERGLNNLIWVLCYTGSPDAAWYPGDEYVDIAGADTYDGGADVHPDMYNTVRSITGSNTDPVAYHECGVPPNPDQCIKQGVMWSWWMIWHTTWLTGNDPRYLNYVFNHELVITLDEVPDIMAVYGWDESCKPASVQPYIRVDEGEWQGGNTLFTGTGSTVTFKPVPDMFGSWNWAGCGLSGTDTMQTASTGTKCISTAVFTNSCGAVSSQTFNIINDCSPYLVTPYASVGADDMQQTSHVYVSFPATVRMAPEAAGTGTWSWNGCGTSGDSRIQDLTVTETCTAVAKFTNNCGETGSVSYLIAPCSPPLVKPYLQVFYGIWQATSDITVDPGQLVTMSPQPVTGGTWEWAGCGVSGVSTAKSVRPDSSCTITATFTSECGSSNSIDFNLTVNNPGGTGISALIAGKGFSVFPSPCRDLLYLKPDRATDHPPFLISVYTTTGVPVMLSVAETSDISLDVSSLLPDIYIIRVSNGLMNRTERFLKVE